jgi:hypothetical protein
MRLSVIAAGYGHCSTATNMAIATAARILGSHQQAFGLPLIAAARPTSNRCTAGIDAAAPLLAQELFAAPIVVLAHDGRGLDQGIKQEFR